MKIHNQSGMLAVAAQQLELDERQYQAGIKDQQSARAAKMAENEHAVEEMHEQAGSIRIGACFEGGLQMIGGAMSLGGALSSSPGKAPDATPAPTEGATCASPPPAPAPAKPEKTSGWSIAGQATSGMASPTGRLLGDAPAKEHEAEAAGHRNLAEQHGWDADDATQRKERADHRADQAMQIMGDAARETREARASVVARLAGA